MGRNAINWFEIPSVDFERAKAYYEAIFETSMHVMEMPQPGGTPLRMAILPYDEGELGGAVVHLPEHQPATAGPLLYLNGNPDLQPYLDRALANGGKLIMGKTRISDDIGFMAIFVDSEGNHMAFHSGE